MCHLTYSLCFCFFLILRVSSEYQHHVSTPTNWPSWLVRAFTRNRTWTWMTSCTTCNLHCRDKALKNDRAIFISFFSKSIELWWKSTVKELVYISRYSVFREKQVQRFMFVMANAYGPTFISLFWCLVKIKNMYFLCVNGWFISQNSWILYLESLFV